MRIVVFGTGGVGGYFGARLAEAGNDVAFVARGRHLDAIRRRGLELKSIHGDVRLREAAAAGRVDASFRPELVLVCVKAWQLDEAAEAIRSMLAENTIVLPLLNGVEAPGQLGEALGSERVLAGLCGIIAFIEAPGVIRHPAVDPFIKFGELDNDRTERIVALESVFTDLRGVRVEIPGDITAALWMKFLFVETTGAIGAITRTPMGTFRSQPESRRLLEKAMREVHAVAVARGVTLPTEAVGKTLAMVDGLPESGTASMQRDLMAGRRSELEAQTGAVVRLGSEAGVPTPVHDFLYASFIASERRARGELDYDI